MRNLDSYCMSQGFRDATATAWWGQTLNLHVCVTRTSALRSMPHDEPFSSTFFSLVPKHLFFFVNQVSSESLADAWLISFTPGMSSQTKVSVSAKLRPNP